MIACRCGHRDFIVPYQTARVARASGIRALWRMLTGRALWVTTPSGGLLTCAKCMHQFGYNDEGNYDLRSTRRGDTETASPAAADERRNGPVKRIVTPDQTWSAKEE